MSYCVNCGVELDRDATSCPLCQTPVINPTCPPDTTATPNFPLERREVEPVNHREMALLLTAMLLSAGICCILLNLTVLWQGIPWSTLVASACVMLWLWVVPPLLFQRASPLLLLGIDLLAAGCYLYVIALAMDGMYWLLGLALPIWGGFSLILLFLRYIIPKRSILSRMLFLIGGTVLFLLWLEFSIDRFLGVYSPTWSVIAAAVGAAFMLPLALIRLRPNLRREVRRRFHF